MYAMERLGSYITRGVYTVSGPFHPFGGAIDVIVVQQEDGSFKSSPWYVRFGKFQGVLKAKEKLVKIFVNGADVDLHMYLDHKGEAYFLRESDSEEGELLFSPSSSGDETDREQKNERFMKTQSSNYKSFNGDSDALIRDENGPVLERSSSKQTRILGLMFGRRSIKENHKVGSDMERVSSLERAEIAADLLEVNWSTNLPTKGRLGRPQMLPSLGSNSIATHNSVDGVPETKSVHDETSNLVVVDCVYKTSNTDQDDLGEKNAADTFVTIKEDVSLQYESEHIELTHQEGISFDRFSLGPDKSGNTVCEEEMISSIEAIENTNIVKGENESESFICHEKREILTLRIDVPTDEVDVIADPDCILDKKYDYHSEFHFGSQELDLESLTSRENSYSSCNRNCICSVPTQQCEAVNDDALSAKPNFNRGEQLVGSISSQEDGLFLFSNIGGLSSEASVHDLVTLDREVKEQINDIVAHDVSHNQSLLLLGSFQESRTRPVAIALSTVHLGVNKSLSKSLPNIHSQIHDLVECDCITRCCSFSMGSGNLGESSIFGQGTNSSTRNRQIEPTTNELLVHKDFQIKEIETVSVHPGQDSEKGHNVEPQVLKVKADEKLKGDASRGNWSIWPFRLKNSKSMKSGNLSPQSTSIIVETKFDSPNKISENDDMEKPKTVKRKVKSLAPSSEQLASLNLRDGQNVVTFSFSTSMLGQQQVDARIYLWKWNTRIVVSDVDGTITKSDVLGQFMPLVGVDWSQTGVANLFSDIKENGYQLLFLSARAISQAYLTRQFLFNLKQDGKALPDGPVVISPDGLFPSLYREVIRRAPHEFKISCLEGIRALFPPDSNPFYAGFGNRDTDEISYLKVGIPKGKIFIINPKGEVAVNRRVDTKSYTTLRALVSGMFPAMSYLEQEDYNSWNYWKLPLPTNINL